MKRLFYCSAFALMISFFSSCAQHDTNSPDTSGAMPYDKPGVGVDTTNTGNRATTPNMSNDHSNKDQGISSDSTTNQQ